MRRVACVLAVIVLVPVLAVSVSREVSGSNAKLFALEREILGAEDITFPNLVRLSQLTQRFKSDPTDSLDLETTTGALPQSTQYEEGVYKTAFAITLHNSGSTDPTVKSDLSSRTNPGFMGQMTPNWGVHGCKNCVTKAQFNAAKGGLARMAEGPVVVTGEAVDSFYDILKCVDDKHKDPSKTEIHITGMVEELMKRMSTSSVPGLKEKVTKMVMTIAGSSNSDSYVSACEYALPFLNEAKKGFVLQETKISWVDFLSKYKAKSLGGSSDVGAPILYAMAQMSQFFDPSSAPGGSSYKDYELNECEASFARHLLDSEATLHDWDYDQFFEEEIAGFRFTTPFPRHLARSTEHVLGYPAFRGVMKVINYGNIAFKTGHTFDMAKLLPVKTTPDGDMAAFALALWTAIDKDGSGSVSADEVAAFLAKLCMNGVADENRRQVAEQILNDFYRDGSTEVTKDEFLRGMASYSALVHFVTVQDITAAVEVLAPSSRLTLPSQELFIRFFLLLLEFSKKAETGKIGGKTFPQWIAIEIKKPKKSTPVVAKVVAKATPKCLASAITEKFTEAGATPPSPQRDVAPTQDIQAPCPTATTTGGNAVLTCSGDGKAATVSIKTACTKKPSSHSTGGHGHTSKTTTTVTQKCTAADLVSHFRKAGVPSPSTQTDHTAGGSTPITHDCPSGSAGGPATLQCVKGESKATITIVKHCQCPYDEIKTKLTSLGVKSPAASGSPLNVGAKTSEIACGGSLAKSVVLTCSAAPRTFTVQGDCDAPKTTHLGGSSKTTTVVTAKCIGVKVFTKLQEAGATSPGTQEDLVQGRTRTAQCPDHETTATVKCTSGASNVLEIVTPCERVSKSVVSAHCSKVEVKKYLVIAGVPPLEADKLAKALNKDQSIEHSCEDWGKTGGVRVECHAPPSVRANKHCEATRGCLKEKVLGALMKAGISEETAGTKAKQLALTEHVSVACESPRSGTAKVTCQVSERGGIAEAAITTHCQASMTASRCGAAEVKKVLESAGLVVEPTVPEGFEEGLRGGVTKRVECNNGHGKGKSIQVSCLAGKDKVYRASVTETCPAPPTLTTIKSGLPICTTQLFGDAVLSGKVTREYRSSLPTTSLKLGAYHYGACPKSEVKAFLTICKPGPIAEFVNNCGKTGKPIPDKPDPLSCSVAAIKTLLPGFYPKAITIDDPLQPGQAGSYKCKFPWTGSITIGCAYDKVAINVVPSILSGGCNILPERDGCTTTYLKANLYKMYTCSQRTPTVNADDGCPNREAHVLCGHYTVGSGQSAPSRGKTCRMARGSNSCHWFDRETHEILDSQCDMPVKDNVSGQTATEPDCPF